MSRSCTATAKATPPSDHARDITSILPAPHHPTLPNYSRQTPAKTMTDHVGYEVIPNAVSPELVQQAAHAMDGDLAVTVKRVKWTEFQIPSICYRIRDEYMQNGDKTLLEKLFDPKQVMQPPVSINVGIFHKTKPDPVGFTGKKGEIYITFALTDLNPDTGWFIFLEGSHRQTPGTKSIGGWKKVGLNIKAGDALAWRGDLVYLHSSGGGGKFQTLVFEENKVGEQVE